MTQLDKPTSILGGLLARLLPALKDPTAVIGGGPTAGVAAEGTGRGPTNGGYIAKPWDDNTFFI